MRRRPLAPLTSQRPAVDDVAIENKVIADSVAHNMRNLGHFRIGCAQMDIGQEQRLYH